MRRSRLLLSIGATAAVAALLSPVAGQAQATVPSLRLVSTSPVTFRGAGFGSAERVTLMVLTGTKVTRRLVAGPQGGFVVRLPGVDATACQGFSAVALGSRGSRASYKRRPGQCPPPAPPG